MNIVVGSGPAGVSCASALLAAGQDVTMIDAGAVLDRGALAAKSQLAMRDPGNWTAEHLSHLAHATPRTGVAPDKTSHGSDYPYRPPAGATQLNACGTGLKPSYAVGGFSTVWGGAILPYAHHDIADWPVSLSDLQRGYRFAVETLVDGQSCPDLRLSSQAHVVHTRANRYRDRLRAAGVEIGRSQLAIRSRNCRYCGLCLKGCPQDLIYSAEGMLPALTRAGMHYESGLLVNEFREATDGVEVLAHYPDGTRAVLRGSRLWLGAGVVNTAEILLRSRGLFERPVKLLDSQHFMLPAVTWRGSRDVQNERLHTLSQLFVSIRDGEISGRDIHLQVYSYNDMIRDAVGSRLSAWGLSGLTGKAVDRLMLIGGYLHSDDSGHVEATLQRDGHAETMHLSGKPSARARTVVKKLTRRLRNVARMTGLLPVSPLNEITEPGRSFHCGGSFPMSRNPGPTETDIVGRPFGHERVHLIDASIFPTVPAKTITLSVMANAHRIASTVAQAKA